VADFASAALQKNIPILAALCYLLIMDTFDNDFRGRAVTVSPQETEGRSALRALAKEALIFGIALPVSLVGRLLGADPGAGYLAVRSIFEDEPTHNSQLKLSKPTSPRL
jgi:hypothetical protein